MTRIRSKHVRRAHLRRTKHGLRPVRAHVVSETEYHNQGETTVATPLSPASDVQCFDMALTLDEYVSLHGDHNPLIAFEGLRFQLDKGLEIEKKIETHLKLAASLLTKDLGRASTHAQTANDLLDAASHYLHRLRQVRANPALAEQIGWPGK